MRRRTRVDDLHQRRGDTLQGLRCGRRRKRRGVLDWRAAVDATERPEPIAGAAVGAWAGGGDVVEWGFAGRFVAGEDLVGLIRR